MLSRILTISHPPAQWPHGCSLPGQLGRGAQLREVQKVVLEDEPRKDGPFLAVHGVLKPPMTSERLIWIWPVLPVLLVLSKKDLQR